MMEAATGLWALKSQIYKVTAMAHGMWWCLIQAGERESDLWLQECGIATMKHLYALTYTRCHVSQLRIFPYTKKDNYRRRYFHWEFAPLKIFHTKSFRNYNGIF